MGFSSQNDYDNFIRILDEKVKNQKMKINSSLEEANSILGINYYTYVTCCNCGENWFLEMPDHSKRGYFLNKQGVGIYYAKKDEHDRKVKRNGLIILTIILIISIYKCI
ncbi:hypothetical protein [Fluviicola sp.]|uniref:hypothetical protein n=1 Tax=Fluviicola sp. TaxID=1917219 RepID=UPI003D2792A3